MKLIDANEDDAHVWWGGGGLDVHVWWGWGCIDAYVYKYTSTTIPR